MIVDFEISRNKVFEKAFVLVDVFYHVAWCFENRWGAVQLHYFRLLTHGVGPALGFFNSTFSI